MRTERNAILRRNPSEQENLYQMILDLTSRVAAIEVLAMNAAFQEEKKAAKKSKS